MDVIRGFINDEYLPELELLNEKFNRKIRALFTEIPPLREGDIIKTKDGDIYKIHCIGYYDAIHSKIKTEAYGRYLGDYCNLFDIQINLYKTGFYYVVKRRLRSGKWSERSEQLRYKDTYDLFIYSNEQDEFIKADTADHDLLYLLYQVNEILSEIKSDRLKVAMSKYCKSANVPKSTVEKHPEIIELHNKIQTLIKFKNTIQLPL